MSRRQCRWWFILLVGTGLLAVVLASAYDFSSGSDFPPHLLLQQQQRNQQQHLQQPRLPQPPPPPPLAAAAAVAGDGDHQPDSLAGVAELTGIAIEDLGSVSKEDMAQLLKAFVDKDGLKLGSVQRSKILKDYWPPPPPLLAPGTASSASQQQPPLTAKTQQAEQITADTVERAHLPLEQAMVEQEATVVEQGKDAVEHASAEQAAERVAAGTGQSRLESEAVRGPVEKKDDNEAEQTKVLPSEVPTGRSEAPTSNGVSKLPAVATTRGGAAPAPAPTVQPAVDWSPPQPQTQADLIGLPCCTCPAARDTPNAGGSQITQLTNCAFCGQWYSHDQRWLPTAAAGSRIVPEITEYQVLGADPATREPVSTGPCLRLHDTVTYLDVYLCIHAYHGHVLSLLLHLLLYVHASLYASE